jgi:spectinomycin phosphotransferase
MHAIEASEAWGLRTYDEPVVRTAGWIDAHLASAQAALRGCGLDSSRLNALVAERLDRVAPIPGLPLAGCSFDFKASNLVFDPKPTLVDPDHAAMIPRLYDLAVALLLFHCDLLTAPARLWDETEWRIFLTGYREEVMLTRHEVRSWAAVLNLAWLDQAVWLLGNWPEGWADSKERQYLADLAFIDLERFSLPADAPA